MAFSMRKELLGIMPGGALARLGLKRANKKVVKVSEAREAERGRQGTRGREREKGGPRLPRATFSLSLSFAFTSSSSSPALTPLSPSTHLPLSFLLLPDSSTILTFGGRSSFVPQYVTTTRHTLLAGAQDNCPHYSYLKSAPRARTRAADIKMLPCAN